MRNPTSLAPSRFPVVTILAVATLLLGGPFSTAQVYDVGVENPGLGLTIETSDPAKPKVVGVHIDASPGDWVVVFARAVLPRAGIPTQEYDAYIAQYPWIEETVWTASQLNEVLAEAALPPETGFAIGTSYIDPAVIADHWASVVAGNGDGLIRTGAQPVHDSRPVAGTALYRRSWVLDSDTWNPVYTGPAQPMRELWWDRLAGVELGYEDDNTTWLSFDRILTQCVFAQAGDESIAGDFINQPGGMATARAMGLSIAIQAVSYRDFGGPPTTGWPYTDPSIPGLPSLNLSPLPPRPPTPRLSGARIIRMGVGHPATGVSLAASGPITEVLYGPVATAGGHLLLPLDGMAGPFSCVIRWGNRERTLNGHFHATGSIRFPMPSGIPVGTVLQIASITNAVGTTSGAGMPWEFVVVGP